ncbi:MAG: FixH family protein [Alphaproteobacteria bacterium]|nr:FixH family protein [Alphaproteobacteria bacterium]
MSGHRGFEITGRHVLLAMIGFFALVIGVNAVFITLATRSFPGLVVDEPFTRGLARTINAELDARAEQARRGWQAAAAVDTTPDGVHRLTVVMSDAGGRPLEGLALSGELRRAATDTEDLPLAFTPEGAGRYSAELTGVGAGRWTMHIVTAFDDGSPFEARKQLWIK